MLNLFINMKLAFGRLLDENEEGRASQSMP